MVVACFRIMGSGMGRHAGLTVGEMEELRREIRELKEEIRRLRERG
jgi:ribosomal protein L10